MSSLDIGSLLTELDDQPEEVRRIFIYAICQTMVEAGHLQFEGASEVAGVGTMLIYRNMESDAVFEILKPDISADDEDQIRQHIKSLLEKQ